MVGPIEHFEIVCYNDLSLGNLKDGGSQGGFIIYRVGGNNVSLPIMWNSKKLCRVVENVMAAETLNPVEATEACFWLANILSEALYVKTNALFEDELRPPPPFQKHPHPILYNPLFLIIPEPPIFKQNFQVTWNLIVESNLAHTAQPWQEHYRNSTVTHISSI